MGFIRDIFSPAPLPSREIMVRAFDDWTKTVDFSEELKQCETAFTVLNQHLQIIEQGDQGDMHDHLVDKGVFPPSFALDEESCSKRSWREAVAREETNDPEGMAKTRTKHQEFIKAIEELSKKIELFYTIYDAIPSGDVISPERLAFERVLRDHMERVDTVLGTQGRFTRMVGGKFSPSQPSQNRP